MSDFDKELGVWQTEQEKVMIPAYEVDLKSHTARQVEVEKTVDVQVMYTKPEAQHFSCAKGVHEWELLDPRKYIIHCKNCPMHRVLIPGNHKLVNGQVFHRQTGKFLF